MTARVGLIEAFVVTGVEFPVNSGMKGRSGDANRYYARFFAYAFRPQSMGGACSSVG